MCMCIVTSEAPLETQVEICFHYLSVANAPPVIQMQAPKRVIVTQDESLSLTCNTSNVNGEIHLKWVTPPSSVRPFSLLFAVLLVAESTRKSWTLSIDCCLVRFHCKS